MPAHNGFGKIHRELFNGNLLPAVSVTLPAALLPAFTGSSFSFDYTTINHYVHLFGIIIAVFLFYQTAIFFIKGTVKTKGNSYAAGEKRLSAVFACQKPGCFCLVNTQSR